MHAAHADNYFEGVYAALPPDTDVVLRTLFASKQPFTIADAEHLMSELCVLPISTSACEKLRDHLGRDVMTFASFRRGFAYAVYHGLSDVAPPEGEGIEAAEEGVRKLKEALHEAVARAEKLTPKKSRRTSLLLSPSLSAEYFTPRENPTTLSQDQVPQRASRKETQPIDHILQASPELWHTPRAFVTSVSMSEPHSDQASGCNAESSGNDRPGVAADKENESSNSSRKLQSSNAKAGMGTHFTYNSCFDDELSNEMNCVERLFQDDESECDSLSSVYNALSRSVSNSAQDNVDRLDSSSQTGVVPNNCGEDGRAVSSAVSSEEHRPQNFTETPQGDASKDTASMPDHISPTTIQVGVPSGAFTPADKVSQSTLLSCTDGSFTTQDDISHSPLELNSLLEVDEQSQVLQLSVDSEILTRGNDMGAVLEHTQPTQEAQIECQKARSNSSEHGSPVEEEVKLNRVTGTNDDCGGSEASLNYICGTPLDEQQIDASSVGCVHGIMPTITTSQKASVSNLEVWKDKKSSRHETTTNTCNKLPNMELQSNHASAAIKSSKITFEGDSSTDQSSTYNGKGTGTTGEDGQCSNHHDYHDSVESANHVGGRVKFACGSDVGSVNSCYESSGLGSVRRKNSSKDDEQVGDRAKQCCVSELEQIERIKDHDSPNRAVCYQQSDFCVNGSCDRHELKDVAVRQSLNTLVTGEAGIHNEQKGCLQGLEAFEDDSIYASPTPMQTIESTVVDELHMQKRKHSLFQRTFQDRHVTPTEKSLRVSVTCEAEVEKKNNIDNRTTEEISQEWDVDDALDCQEAVEHASAMQNNSGQFEARVTTGSVHDGVSVTCEFTPVQGIELGYALGSMPTPCAPTPPSSGWPLFCPRTPPSEVLKRTARSSRLPNSPPSEFQSPILVGPQSPVNESSRKLLFSDVCDSAAVENGSTVSIDTRDSLTAAVQNYVKSAQKSSEICARVEIESEESDVTPEGFGQIRKVKPSPCVFSAVGEEVQEVSEGVIGSVVSGRPLSGKASEVSSRNDEVLTAVRECLKICREVRTELGIRKRRRRLELSMWLLGVLAMGMGVWVRRKGVVSFVEVML